MKKAKVKSLTEVKDQREKSSKIVKVKGYRRSDGTVVKASVREYDPTENVLNHVNAGMKAGALVGAAVGGTGGFALGGVLSGGNPVGISLGSISGGTVGASEGKLIGAQLGIAAYNTRSSLNKLRPSVRKKVKPLNKDIKKLETTISKSRKPNPQLITARDELRNRRLRIYDDFNKMFIGNYEFRKFNLKKLGKVLTKKRSFGGSKKIGSPKPQAKRPTGPLQKGSSSGIAKQNAARAKFEGLGKKAAKPPSAKAQSAFNNLGTRTSGGARKKKRRNK